MLALRQTLPTLLDLNDLLNDGALDEGAEPLRHGVVEVAPVRPIAEGKDEGNILFAEVVVTGDVFELEQIAGVDATMQPHGVAAERDTSPLPKISDVATNRMPFG